MTSQPERFFASDNASGAHPEILRALESANLGHARAYGDDPWSERCTAVFRRHFGERSVAYPVFNGTGANVVALAALARPYESVICSPWAHIAVDECGAPERFGGFKLIAAPADLCDRGKLTREAIAAAMKGVGDQHHSQPRVVSITQASELGTVYRPDEIRAIADDCHARGLRLHVDGARLCNASAALNLPLAALTTECGVDAVSFGGTKNGLLFGDAVVWPEAKLAPDFKYLRKQGMQLASKHRFLAAQFEALLSGDLWSRCARHANAMAALLGRRAAAVPGIRLARPVEANAVFAWLARDLAEAVRREHFFYLWDDPGGPEVEARWVASFDTTEGDIDAFVRALLARTSRI